MAKKIFTLPILTMVAVVFFYTFALGAGVGIAYRMGGETAYAMAK
jgi:uncharacterized membrane-anchored protein YitT (DUF2179 family)